MPYWRVCVLLRRCNCLEWWLVAVGGCCCCCVQGCCFLIYCLFHSLLFLLSHCFDLTLFIFVSWLFFVFLSHFVYLCPSRCCRLCFHVVVFTSERMSVLFEGHESTCADRFLIDIIRMLRCCCLVTLSIITFIKLHLLDEKYPGIRNSAISLIILCVSGIF